MRIQPKSRNRKRLYAGIDKVIKSKIEQTSIQYNVSKSWVTAIILAEYYGIRIPKFDKEY